MAWNAASTQDLLATNEILADLARFHSSPWEKGSF